MKSLEMKNTDSLLFMNTFYFPSMLNISQMPCLHLQSNWVFIPVSAGKQRGFEFFGFDSQTIGVMQAAQSSCPHGYYCKN